MGHGWVQVRVETCVEKGDPRDVICGAAEKAGADMVVMGSHGYGFPAEGAAGERQQPLRAELQVPRRRRQEARRRAPGGAADRSRLLLRP